LAQGLLNIGRQALQLDVAGHAHVCVDLHVGTLGCRTPRWLALR
jgi:hypothetical protein